jgi:pSer/pThr/pTyr-binding forkhead associated (FHA) protein
MPELAVAESKAKSWLVCRSGPLAGTRYQIGDGATRIGRGVENDIVVRGSNTATVSAQHVEIVRDGTGWCVRDLGSTNGTWLNGEKITEAELEAGATIRLGSDGPEFAFSLEEPPASELDQTLVVPEGILATQLLPTAAAPAIAPESPHEELLAQAVTRARRARVEGWGDQTMTFVREALHHALQRSHRRFKVVIAILAAVLVIISGVGSWRISHLTKEKAAIDVRIREIDAQLQQQNSREQTDNLIAQLDAYSGEAQTLARSLLYRLRSGEKEDFVTQEIRTVMQEFGAEVYSIPPEFIERVNFHMQNYQGPNRELVETALTESKSRIATMKKILEQEKLPPDFAWVPLVESGFRVGQSSGAGAAGPWQLTAPTARQFGLRVDGAVDERDNLVKSTHAACAVLRTLLLDFGSGSSVMLALAAYNLGPAKVKVAINKAVQDPIKQRNFWYLYRARALPAETREFVPKVFAAIIIGRTPEKFGF